MVIGLMLLCCGISWFCKHTLLVLLSVEMSQRRLVRSLNLQAEEIQEQRILLQCRRQ